MAPVLSFLIGFALIFMTGATTDQIWQAVYDSSNSAIRVTGGGGGSLGTVTSVAQTVPGGFSVSGSPVTTSGTLAITANGTSGGVPYYSATTTMASSGALGATNIVVGGGAGAAPTTLAATDNAVPVGNGTIVQLKAIPDCTDTGGNHLNYTDSTNVFSCGTSGASGTPTSARVTNDAAQSINDNTITAVGFNTEDFDNGGMHDNSTNNTRLTIPTSGDGVYTVTCSVAFGASNTTGQRQILLKKNGTTYLGTQNQFAPSASITSNLTIATTVSLVATDYVECHIFQNSGGPVSTTQASDYTPVFSIVKN